MYKIYIDSSNCERCGKKHKKIFEIDGKKYGGSCAREILGLNLDAPVWLYELAEKYVQKVIKDVKDGNDYLDHKVEDFEVNFYNTHT